MPSKADTLIDRIFKLADELDATPYIKLALESRELASAFEEYFIAFGKPDAPRPQGIIAPCSGKS